MPEPIPRRHYDDDFKRAAVKTLLESGKPVTAVAADIGIEQSNLHKWKKKFAHELTCPPDDAEHGGSQHAEITSLRRDVDSIKQTVDDLRNIVKKTLGARYSL
jgi:transposase